MDRVKYLMLSVFSLLVLLSATASCKDDDDVTNDSKSEEKIPVEISLRPTSFEFSKNAQETEFYVVSDEDPSVSVSADWCKVELKSKDEYRYTYLLSVEANSDFEVRNCDVNVTIGSSFNQSIFVSQAPSPLLRIDSGVPVIDALEGSAEYHFTIEANTLPTVSCSELWVEVSDPVVEGNLYKYVVSISENYFSKERSATVSFSVEDLLVSIAVSQSASTTPISAVKAVDVVKLMSAGINIGNTLEAIGGETAWGQPKINDSYIKGLKDAGFNAVRIPCSWNQYLDTKGEYGENTIKADWMERVTQVVDMVISNDMFAILNAHWDGGWLEDNISASVNDKINKKQYDIWKQIAVNFKDYDSHLLFAGMNEPNHSKSEQTEETTNTMRIYQQTFVDAVRNTGGNNVSRILIVQGPSTDINASVEYYQSLPTDPAGDGYMLMEVHYYDPYQFTLMEDDASWGKVFFFWGKDNLIAGHERNTGDYGDEAYLEKQMKKMFDNYVSKGYPVIIGEYAASIKSQSKYGMTDDEYAKHKASVAFFDGCVAKYAKQNGCVPFLWECGETFNRNDGTVKEQAVVDAIIKGVFSVNYPF